MGSQRDPRCTQSNIKRIYYKNFEFGIADSRGRSFWNYRYTATAPGQSREFFEKNREGFRKDVGDTPRACFFFSTVLLVPAEFFRARSRRFLSLIWGPGRVWISDSAGKTDDRFEFDDFSTGYVKRKKLPTVSGSSTLPRSMPNGIGGFTRFWIRSKSRTHI